jgi:hypothetical protein
MIKVWDFAGDGYVHRLIYHKGEGGVNKLVEVADPRTASNQRPHTAPLSDSAEEEMVSIFMVLMSGPVGTEVGMFSSRLAVSKANGFVSDPAPTCVGTDAS